VRYEILGPLRVVNEGHSSLVTAGKVEVLLAALLVRADRIVSVDQLIAEIWRERSPRRATACVHVYVSCLRKFLRHAGQAEGSVVTQPPGYMLRLGGDEFDLRECEKLIAEGRACSRERRYEEAIDRLGRALALYRGPVLENTPRGPILDGFVAWVDEMRLEGTELLIDSHLELGNHRELIGWLYTLITEHPLREAFYRQLMLALYRSEHQANALRVYRDARRIVVGELGLEPGPALQELHNAILMADPRLTLGARRAASARRAAATPLIPRP
jgi:DNA-binding SARP family transcriptional activator